MDQISGATLLISRRPRAQFFITTVETTFLDGKHTVFGRILPGDNQSMLSVRKIEAVPTGAGDRPKLVVRIVGEFGRFRGEEDLHADGPTLFPGPNVECGEM